VALSLTLCTFHFDGFRTFATEETPKVISAQEYYRDSQEKRLRQQNARGEDVSIPASDTFPSNTVICTFESKTNAKHEADKLCD